MKEEKTKTNQMCQLTRVFVSKQLFINNYSILNFGKQTKNICIDVTEL